MSMQVESVAQVPVDDGVQVVVTRDMPVVDRSLVEQLVGDARAQGIAIDGEGGLLAQLTELVVESAPAVTSQTRAALKCVYLAVIAPDPTGKSRAR